MAKYLCVYNISRIMKKNTYPLVNSDRVNEVGTSMLSELTTT